MIKKFVVIMGPQGSGKTTQARLLSNKCGYGFISAGSLLRSLKKEHDPIGELLSDYWIKGKFVPNFLIEELMFRMFDKTHNEKIVLDGFPRDKNQLKSLLKRLKKRKWEIQHAFVLDIDEKTTLNRIKKRAKVENRADEKDIEVIKKRIKLYYSKTREVVDWYMSAGMLTRIDGTQSIKQIHTTIIQVLYEKNEK